MSPAARKNASRNCGGTLGATFSRDVELGARAGDERGDFLGFEPDIGHVPEREAIGDLEAPRGLSTCNLHL